ncbi:hypothetical protein G5I_14344 [Acromyrmex echinatior]|uniref:Uncharacterized protein n=1 Tax=Acromyrmex echinatior TaxID=103372 RepID=F4X7G5_ACREC|nr:hypothetical protein G5I_14344 [Acromyrmex echinatior]
MAGLLALEEWPKGAITWVRDVYTVLAPGIGRPLSSSSPALVYIWQLREGTLAENGLQNDSRLTLLPSVETGLLRYDGLISQVFITDFYCRDLSDRNETGSGSDFHLPSRQVVEFPAGSSCSHDGLRRRLVFPSRPRLQPGFSRTWHTGSPSWNGSSLVEDAGDSGNEESVHGGADKRR